MNMLTMPETSGPSNSASRLVGVTRKRSITPAWSSKNVPNPALVPLPNASSARMPGRNTSSTLPPVLGSTGTCLSSGVNSAR